jgi:cytochrome c
MKIVKRSLWIVCVLLLCSHAFAEAPKSDQAKQLVTLVDRAAAVIEKKGKDAFPDLRKKDGDWWKGDLYVFVDSMDGVVLVHPFDTAIEGQNLLQDPASKDVMTLLIEKARTEGSGWVEYMWPKPGETAPSNKMSYIRKVKMPDGMEVIVGAGMYQIEQ